MNTDAQKQICVVTICLDTKVKEKLTSLKHHSRESYSSVIERLANLALDEKPLSDETIHGIEEALEDIISVY